MVTTFTCVVCGAPLTRKRAVTCAEQGIAGCCGVHQAKAYEGMTNGDPTWPERFAGGWRKNAGDDFWYCESAELLNDGKQVVFGG